MFIVYSGQGKCQPGKFSRGGFLLWVLVSNCFEDDGQVERLARPGGLVFILRRFAAQRGIGILVCVGQVEDQRSRQGIFANWPTSQAMPCPRKSSSAPRTSMTRTPGTANNAELKPDDP